MALAFADRVQETTTTTGTGTVSLAGASSGYQSFIAGIGNGNTCYYAIQSGSAWEVGIGTVTSGSPNTLSRSTILASSNSGSAITLAGTSTVWCDVPASVIGSLSAGSFGYTAPDSTAAFTGVYLPLTGIPIAADDAYSFRMRIKGLDSSHSVGLYVLNGRTSAAAGYLFQFQNDGNIVLYPYNNGVGGSLQATGTGTLNASHMENAVIEATIMFGSTNNYIQFGSSGLAALTDDLVSFAGGSMYVGASAQAFADIIKIEAQKLA